ncbi:hypothetical protein FHT12_000569 [Xanthomonas campestris]|nr:hypothetical protein [Xanthomonas euroxanthea]
MRIAAVLCAPCVFDGQQRRLCEGGYLLPYTYLLSQCRLVRYVRTAPEGSQLLIAKELPRAPVPWVQGLGVGPPEAKRLGARLVPVIAFARTLKRCNRRRVIAVVNESIGVPAQLPCGLGFHGLNPEFSEVAIGIDKGSISHAMNSHLAGLKISSRQSSTEAIGPLHGYGTQSTAGIRNRSAQQVCSLLVRLCAFHYSSRFQICGNERSEEKRSGQISPMKLNNTDTPDAVTVRQLDRSSQPILIREKRLATCSEARGHRDARLLSWHRTYHRALCDTPLTVGSLVSSWIELCNCCQPGRDRLLACSSAILRSARIFDLQQRATAVHVIDICSRRPNRIAGCLHFESLNVVVATKAMSGRSGGQAMSHRCQYDPRSRLQALTLHEAVHLKGEAVTGITSISTIDPVCIVSRGRFLPVICIQVITERARNTKCMRSRFFTPRSFARPLKRDNRSGAQTMVDISRRQPAMRSLLLGLLGFRGLDPKLPAIAVGTLSLNMDVSHGHKWCAWGAEDYVEIGGRPLRVRRMRNAAMHIGLRRLASEHGSNNFEKLDAACLLRGSTTRGDLFPDERKRGGFGIFPRREQLRLKRAERVGSAHLVSHRHAAPAVQTGRAAHFDSETAFFDVQCHRSPLICASCWSAGLQAIGKQTLQLNGSELRPRYVVRSRPTCQRAGGQDVASGCSEERINLPQTHHPADRRSVPGGGKTAIPAFAENSVSLAQVTHLPQYIPVMTSPMRMARGGDRQQVRPNANDHRWHSVLRACHAATTCVQIQAKSERIYQICICEMFSNAMAGRRSRKQLRRANAARIF